MPDNGKRWPYTTKQNPCHVCGRAGWCKVSADGGTALCHRIQSDKVSRAGDGWFHPIAGRARAVYTPTTSPAAPTRNDLPLLARKFATNIAPGRLQLLGSHLGISVESLKRLHVGWSAGERMYSAKRGRDVQIFAYSFPMVEPTSGAVCGLRMRSQDDFKFSFTGGVGGMFIPRDLVAGVRGYLVEGPTECGAALDMQLNAFGRESANAGQNLITATLKRYRFSELVIIANRDTAKERVKGRPDLGVFYPGQDGAKRTAAIARLHVPVVRIIMPPDGFKDLRKWRHAGAQREDVEREVLRTQPVSLTVTRQKHELEGAGAA